MKLLASLVSVALLAAPGAAASSRLASSASAPGLASESTYAANNPVARVDPDGTFAPLIAMGIVGISIGIMGGFESDTVVVDDQGQSHGGANLAMPLAMAAAPAVAELAVAGAIASAEGIVATGTALGSTLGVGGEVGVLVTGGAAAATAVAAGATAVQIGATLQMSGNRGERNKARSSQGTSNPEKAARKTRDHQTGKKTNDAQPTRTKAEKKADRAARKEAKEQEQAKRMEELKKELGEADGNGNR